LTVYQTYAAHIAEAIRQLTASGDLPAGLDTRAVTVEAPRDPTHGDLATNAAMVLAKPAGMKPREIAVAIAQILVGLPDVAACEIAGPGFLNLRLVPGVWADELRMILADGPDYGRSTVGAGQRVNVEYVSANPTGPMHMGHCRGAVVGDALANLLAYAGYTVTREYYINDAGGQVDTLARSVHLRYLEALGGVVTIPEGFYPGDYLIPVGEALAAEFGDAYALRPEAEWLSLFRTRAVAMMMDLIRADLALLGIHHDVFTSEAAIVADGAADRAMATLAAKGLIYDGVLEQPKGELRDDWEPVPLTLFRATRFGDDQDRPVKKSDGSWTYFGIDVANHGWKADHADALIDIWGADHGGTVKRIEAAVAALTDGRVAVDVKLVQMVRLFRAGEPVKMSKRSGSFVTLADVVREVGKDVVRFIMLTKKADSQLDFDFAKVVEASRDNPVFYVQYAHARVASLGRRAAEAGMVLPDPDLTRLDAEELALVQLAAQWPKTVEAAAASREPHRITFYHNDLAAAFHSLWNRGNDDPARRFLIEDDLAVTAARLALARGVAQVIANGLGVIGVEPAEELH
jgi:arginyl-tRNA synthetase